MAETPAGTWVPHYLLAFGGSYYSSEIWECTMRFLDPANRGPEAMVGMAEDFLPHAKTVIRNWLMAQANGFSAAAKLGWIKFNPVNDRGRYISQTETFQDKWSPEEQGGSAAWSVLAAAPPDVAWAITFHTAYRGPRRAHGRIYLPCQVPSIGAGGRAAQTALDAVAAGAQTMVNNINNFPGVDLGLGPRLAVASRRSARYGTDPVMTEVNEVWVGDVLDTQRRRGNKIRELYTRLPVTTA